MFSDFIKRRPAFVPLLLLLASLLSLEAVAQIRPVYDRGASGLIQALKRLNTNASVLMIGAHPDDEDTAMLSYLARGENARTAYLSLTRGDGGQNIIGPELGESLGVIRTEELLQARTLDGAVQFFTRAYDYGFSKTLAEAREKWDEELVLCDTVRVIRHFRPQIVISQFSGTPTDGHGQHQYSGYISPIAVKAATDKDKCKQAGPVWTVSKFYVRHGFRATGQPRLRVNTGGFDPVIGRAYFEIAMEARSQHRSQEQGVLELRGEQFSGLNLAGGGAEDSGIFHGIDRTVSGALNAGAVSNDAVRSLIAELSKLSNSAIEKVDVRNPETILPDLAKAYGVTVRGIESSTDPTVMGFFRTKQSEVIDAIKLAAGIQFDALSNRETIVPGETFFVGAKIYAHSRSLVNVRSISVAAPPRWRSEPAPIPTTNSPGFIIRENAISGANFNVTVPSDAQPTQPYWLKDPRDGELFRWSGDEPSATEPFDPPVAKVKAVVEISGIALEIEQPVEFRFADDTRGEIRRNINIVPSITIEMDQSLIVVPTSDQSQKRRLNMVVTNYSRSPISGTVGLNINADKEWGYIASTRSVTLSQVGEQATVSFEVTIPEGTRPGEYSILANVMVGESLATSRMRTIAYPHIQTHRFYQRAVAEVRVLDLKVAPVKIGYIMGSGDKTPEAIGQMGLGVEMLTDNEVANGDLSRFDVIVVGIRAYQVRPALAANNKRLIDYLSNGGTLIVQYQLTAYAQQNLMPYPAQMGPRVVDENAVVTFAAPEHPILNFPNKMGSADFDGWVQERNLYNFSTMDERYTGILESHDVGEAENRGGLVAAKVGKGNYVYCSYSLFRQLPAGVPGSYRLLANLLSLPKAGN